MTPNPMRDLYAMEKLYPQRAVPARANTGVWQPVGAAPAAIWALLIALAVAGAGLHLFL